jgi:SAM-dependent methyltransferase
MPSSYPALVADAGRRLLGSRQINHLVRFEPVLELIRGAPTQGLTLLDVGSGSRGIGALLPAGWEVTSVDANFEDYGAAPGSGEGLGRVIGDVRALPFVDSAFDVVVAVDLLEHVPAEGRAQAVREICRVAKARAVMAFPAGEAALAADRRLAQNLSARGRAVPPWLVEHLDHGFPEVAKIVAVAAPFGAVRVAGNESITAHERLVWAELHYAPALVLRLLSRALEPMLASDRRRARCAARAVLHRIRGRDSPPAYRAVVAVDVLPVGSASAP